MNAALLIYLAGVSDGLKGLFIGVALVCIVLAWILPIIMDFMDFEVKDLKKPWSMLAAGCFLSAIFSVLIPDKQTIYLMAAGKVAQDIVESPQTKEIGEKILKVIESKLDEASK